jgi:hypothetical protein
MNGHGYLERYWCPLLMSGSLMFIAAVVMAPLWR